MKVLVLCPFLKHLGGVANHYAGLKSYWTENINYQEVGRRTDRNGEGKYWFIIDVVKFIRNIIFFRPDYILLNPSIGINALKRDFMFQRIAKFLGVRTVLFIHGFNIGIFNNLNKQWLRDNFNRASLIFVLASSFKSELESIGVTTKIKLSCTKVEDTIISDFNISSKIYDGKTLLFVSRIERTKGVYEVIETFKMLQSINPSLILNIVGDGSELENIKRKIDIEGINNVIISGRLVGDALKDAYKSASILILLSYSEGMPTVVLEGMAFGLPIVTRKVGGLVDFFEDQKMGFISSSLDPQIFANAILEIIGDPQKVKSIGLFNHKYAISNFLASRVVKHIENDLKEIKC